MTTPVRRSLQSVYLNVKTHTMDLAEALRIMQQKYPGDYYLEEHYDPNRQCYALRPKFRDPKKEMLWKIEHGY